MIRKVIEYNNNKYKTTIDWFPHYQHKGNANVLKQKGNRKYYDVCLWLSSGLFGWQVIKYNEQYYVGAPGITDYLLYEGELDALDIIKFIIKEYGNNDKICLDPDLFTLLKYSIGNK